MLDEAVRVCKEEGYIVLVERGLSNWSPLNWFLSYNEERFFFLKKQYFLRRIKLSKKILKKFEINIFEVLLSLSRLSAQ